MPDTKKLADPAPGGVLRICWASSFEPYEKRVAEEPVMAKKAKRTRKAK